MTDVWGAHRLIGRPRSRCKDCVIVKVGLLLDRASHVLHAALSTCFAKNRVDAPTAAEINLRVFGNSADD